MLGRHTLGSEKENKSWWLHWIGPVVAAHPLYVTGATLKMLPPLKFQGTDFISVGIGHWLKRCTSLRVGPEAVVLQLPTSTYVVETRAAVRQDKPASREAAAGEHH